MALHSGPDGERLQSVAEAIIRRGWTLPALLVMEIGRPFAFLLGQAVWVAQPALSMLWPAERIGEVAALVESPTVWDELQRTLSRAGGDGADE